MELVNRARTAYFSAARDETRSSALADVSRQWEMPVPLTETPEEPASFSRPLDNPVVNVDQKLGMIRLPRVQLDGATVQEAVDYLRSQARTHDATAMTAAERGVNISVDPGPADSVSARDAAAKRITLNLQNVPLREALEYVARASRPYSADKCLWCGTGIQFRRNFLHGHQVHYPSAGLLFRIVGGLQRRKFRPLQFR